MRTDRQSIIVVGVSGSAASVAALRQAAAEARLRGAALSVVHAVDPLRDPAPYAPLSGRARPEEDWMIGRRRLAAAVHAAFGAEPPVGMATELAEGPAERVLVGRSADADLLVLGTTTPACQARRSIGPVIRACLSRARCAVLIVRAAAQPQAAFRSHLGERTPHRLREAGEADA